MLSQSELEAIRGRAEAATNPPWSHWPQTSLSIRPRETVMAKTGPGLGCLIGEEITEPDATFIAHARTDVPALLAIIDEVRASLVKHFDDVDLDCEGKPNDLESVVSLACDEIKSTRSHRERETNRANVAEHKVGQLRSRFALELAKQTTPDMSELQRQANRITELEDVGKDNQYIVETLSRALRVDLGAHCITELVHAAADMIEKLKDINGGLRKWQDVARPKLEAIRLAAWDVVHTPTRAGRDVRLVDDDEYCKLMAAFESEATP